MNNFVNVYLSSKINNINVNLNYNLKKNDLFNHICILNGTKLKQNAISTKFYKLIC